MQLGWRRADNAVASRTSSRRASAAAVTCDSTRPDSDRPGERTGSPRGRGLGSDASLVTTRWLESDRWSLRRFSATRTPFHVAA